MDVDKDALQLRLEDYGWWTVGWSVVEDAQGVLELEAYSPAGEDVVLDLHGATLEELARSAQEAYEDFDPEEHAAGWYGANRGEPRSLRLLLDDAESIEDMYDRLATGLTGLWRSEQAAVVVVAELFDDREPFYNDDTGRIYYPTDDGRGTWGVHVLDVDRDEVANAVSMLYARGVEPDCWDIIETLLHDVGVVSDFEPVGSTGYRKAVEDVAKGNFDIYGTGGHSPSFMVSEEMGVVMRHYVDDLAPLAAPSVADAARESKEASAEIAAGRTPEQPSREEGR